MKNSILIVAILLGSVTAKAQQLPLISNYLNTAYLFNPAFSGIDGKTEITVLNRRQWTDVQGSPETQFMSFNGNQNDLKFGYSGYAFNDVTDIVSRSGFYGSYAWHVKFSDENSLSLGMGAGYVNNTINIAGIRVQDELDPVLYSQLNRGTFDLNFGFNLKFGDFNIGAAVPNLLAPAIDFSDNYIISPFQYQYMRHFVVNTQYDVQMQKGLMTLSPYLTIRANQVTVPQVDAGLMFNHNEYFFVGAAYRSSYAVTGNAGVHLTENITMGYAYDFSLNTYGFALGNSHEFMLRYSFGESKKDKRLENEIKKLKDRQRRQSGDLEDLLNDRLDEFKDEVTEGQKALFDAEKESMKGELTIAAAEAAANNSQSGSNQNANGSNGGETLNSTNPLGNGSTTTAYPNTPQGGRTNSNIKGYDPIQYAGNVQAGSQGYYVTAGVFGARNNAAKLQNKLRSQGVGADVFQDPSNNMFYVFLLKFNNYESAKQARESGFNGQYGGKLWIKVL
ncbi:MAG: PorP/SprF family type IX secretion system membrane protein [Schleiferiaceae bacterium]|nr:PorP/SprF family type IX secretion system membrane protein [Schleiferiaceae bacterium]